VQTEFQYALLLLRAVATTDGPAPDAVTGTDWSAIERLLGVRGLTATVAPVVETCDVPPAFRQHVVEQARLLRDRSTLFWMETSRVLAELERRRLDAIMLKGPALARTVYPTPDQRLSFDLDLLVPRDALDDSCEALTRLGYRPAATGRHVSFYEDHHFHLILQHPSGAVVELHWDLSRPRNYVRFDLAGFAQRARTIEIDGIAIRVPSNADQLLHAACQGLWHGFTDLRRVLDAALLIRAGVGRAELLVETARRQGMSTPLWLLLDLQRKLIGVETPRELQDAVRPGRFVHRCLASLDVPAALARAGESTDARLKRLLIWLCAPQFSSALAEVGHFLAPGEAEFLEEGYEPGDRPGGPQRVWRGLRRGVSLVRILGRLAWCLARG